MVPPRAGGQDERGRKYAEEEVRQLHLAVWALEVVRRGEGAEAGASRAVRGVREGVDHVIDVCVEEIQALADEHPL